MKLILSSDVELWSWNKNFEQDVKAGVLKLVELAEKEKIPLTLFISLSDKGYGDANYLEKITALIKEIKSKQIHFGIHSHCKNLPIKIKTSSDYLKDYPKEEITEILRWYKKELERITHKKIFLHRAGSYAIPELELLDKCFRETGLRVDSSDISKEYSKLLKLKNLIEIPPATNKKYSEKLRVFSPEQMSFEELRDFYNESKEKTEILVINFHSFSVYGNLGWRKKVWYKTPGFLRRLLRPLISLIKNKTSNQTFKINEQKKTSENFKNLEKLIQFLKREKCNFTEFNQFILK